MAIFLSVGSYVLLDRYINKEGIAEAANSEIASPSLPDKNRVQKNELEEKVKEEQMAENIQLDVPFINQMSAPRLYNGCEVTSLAMLLNYHGIEVTKNELAEKTPTVPLKYNNGLRGNPNEGFVGDVVNGPGLSVYHGPIAELAKQYSDQVEDLSGQDVTEIYKKLSNGLPVWIITTAQLTPVNDFEVWDTPQGEVSVTFNVHSVVVTGFDKDYVYVNDPYGTKNRKVNRSNFEKAWEQMGRQAVVINK
ncbi:C39 family peptidase [Bacillus sp. FJAT-50079]|nr:C39 family peptidase [Bacillus sp. FJAT-50079]